MTTLGTNLHAGTTSGVADRPPSPGSDFALATAKAKVRPDSGLFFLLPGTSLPFDLASTKHPL